MQEEFKEILGYLQMPDQSVENLIRDVEQLCKTTAGTLEAIRDIKIRAEDYHSDIRTCDYEAFCQILLSYCYFLRHTSAESVDYSDDAAIGFDRCGNSWNRALALWGKGLALAELGLLNDAMLELQTAKRLAHNIIKEYQRVGHKSEFQSTKRIEERISQRIDSLKTVLDTQHATPLDVNTPKAKPAQNIPTDHKAKSSLWPTGHKASLCYPVYDSVHAGTVGKYVFDDEPVDELYVSDMNINDEKYQLYNLRAGTKIQVLPKGNYYWLRVEGDSMNRVKKSIPIENGDYVLVDTNIQAQISDIVVACLLDSAIPTERAGIIKRFTYDGLSSESNNNYDIIPLTNVDIRGVVIAVAKHIS